MTDISLPVSERRRMLRELSEKELWPVLQTLLLHMQFKWAEITHGVNEQGRDLVACGPTSTGGDELLGVVVKSEKISGGVSGKVMLRSVLDQVDLCFRIKYSGPECRSKRKINRVIVVTNKSISKFARDEISGIDIPYGSIEFWDLAKLEKNVSEYYPAYYLHMKQELHDYLIALRTSCSQMSDLQKNLHIPSSRKLNDVYVDIPMIERFRGSSPRIGGRRFSKKEMSSVFPEIKEPNTIHIDELADPDKDIFIEGTPGSGKSCLLRMSCIRLIDTLLTGSYMPIPLYLNARDIAGCINEGNDVQVLDHVLCVNDSTQETILNCLHEQPFVMYVDGLDEIHRQNDRDKLLGILAEMQNTSHKLKLIVTSRPIHVWQNTSSLAFREGVLLPIQVGAMASLLEKLISKPSLYIEVLRELTESGILDKLPRTPLVITLIALLHEQESSSEIPANLYELYELFCQVHLERWGKRGGKKYDTRIAVLEIIAWDMQLNGNTGITVKDAVELCEGYLTDRGVDHILEYLTDIIRENALIECGELMADDSELNTCCPSEDGAVCKEECLISFVHQSFQEYFCSRYIASNQDLIDSHLVKYFDDPWWGTIGVFISGRLKDIPDLLENIVHTPVTDEKYAFSRMINLGYTAQAATTTRVKSLTMACSHGLELIRISYHHAVAMNERFGMRFTQLELVGALVYTYQHTYASKYLSDILNLLYTEERERFLDSDSDKMREEAGMQLLALAWALASLGNITKMIDIGSITNQADGVLKGIVALLMEDFQKLIESGEIALENEDIRERWQSTNKSVRKEAIKHRKMLMEAMNRKPLLSN